MPGLSDSGVSILDIETALLARGNVATSASVPVAATSAPPAVADSSALGTAAPYARADHTHQSSVQSARLTVSALTGSKALVTWTFSPAFANPPIVAATVENTVSATLPYVVNLAGPATATSVQFIVFQASATTLGGTLTALLGLVVTPFSTAPVPVVIDAIARPA